MCVYLLSECAHSTQQYHLCLCLLMVSDILVYPPGFKKRTQE